jgi:RsiW-degrading membrane proteinase PrsW (M82 family)
LRIGRMSESGRGGVAGVSVVIGVDAGAGFTLVESARAAVANASAAAARSVERWSAGKSGLEGARSQR